LTRPQSNPRRSYGTGNLRVRRGAWVGQWRIGGRQVSRKLGPVRKPGDREGLTRKQAEAELRRRIDATEAVPIIGMPIGYVEARRRADLN
jgi:hypothetical protein